LHYGKKLNKKIYNETILRQRQGDGVLRCDLERGVVGKDGTKWGYVHGGFSVFAGLLVMELY
jgi:hypothetical protein